ncbi:nucleoporin GLE1 [Platysternon megacephalum]|uniref:Nucleoporin GLE1 n=1 Tax=Platysternon megacephalum TaxID=55544 RepID=A0A4D9ELL0_9SAUR|nr:nucleoporin GLE1 [Platysternon megacephalum]
MSQLAVSQRWSHTSLPLIDRCCLPPRLHRAVRQCHGTVDLITPRKEILWGGLDTFPCSLSDEGKRLQCSSSKTLIQLSCSAVLHKTYLTWNWWHGRLLYL